MAMTRAQAQTLLNVSEMSLYGDSRANGLRGLSAAALAKRVERTRKARDRARDLLQRQRLVSRERTGNKRGASGTANQRSKLKATLLADILKRFEARLKLVQKQEKSVKAGAGKRAGKTSTASAVAGKATAKAAPAKRAGKAMTTPAAAAKAADTKQQRAPAKAARKTATGASSRKRAAKRITPEQALANTYRLLDEKKEQEHQSKPWHTLDQEHHLPEAGFQSPQAASKAQELHAGESRMAPIQGSISTRDRKNQGKRDNRGSGSEA